MIERGMSGERTDCCSASLPFLPVTKYEET